jgi:hypothetical protein
MALNFDRGEPYRKGDLILFPKTRNFLAQEFSSNCARPFWVYALTFVPAIVEMTLLPFGFDPEDALRSHGRAISGGRSTAGKRGVVHKSRGKVTKGTKPTQRFSQRALSHLLVWTQPLEFIGLSLLIYETADQVSVRWSGLLEKLAPCDSDLGHFMRSASNQSWNQLSSGGPANMPSLDQNSAGWTNTGFSVNLPPGTYVTAMAARLRPTFPATYQSGIRLQIPGALGPKTYSSGLQTLLPAEPKDFSLFATFSTTAGFGTNLGWQTYGDTVPVGVTAVEARVMVAQQTAF